MENSDLDNRVQILESLSTPIPTLRLYANRVAFTPQFTEALFAALRTVRRGTFVHRHKGHVKVKRGNPFRGVCCRPKDWYTL